MSVAAQAITPSRATQSEGLNISALFADLRPWQRIGCNGEVLIHCDEETYDPKLDPRYDWVARVAIPAFQSVANKRDVTSFLTLGTGVGSDVLAAIEVFGPDFVAFTDLDRGTVGTAASNVVKNLVGVGCPLQMAPGVGDLMGEFSHSGMQFDLVYENLPNIATDETPLLEGRSKATFHRRRGEVIPDPTREFLLELHYLSVLQSLENLASDGITLSSIGGRFDIAEIRTGMAIPEVMQELEVYTWKLQSEPEEVLGGYAKLERADWHLAFYSEETLQRVFEDLTPEEAAGVAEELEEELHRDRISAREAFGRARRGEPIGHTVLVISSREESSR